MPTGHGQKCSNTAMEELHTYHSLERYAAVYSGLERNGTEYILDWSGMELTTHCPSLLHWLDMICFNSPVEVWLLSVMHMQKDWLSVKLKTYCSGCAPADVNEKASVK